MRRTAIGAEARALEQHARGRVGDLGVEAAHHAGERDAAIAVADHEVVLDERALDVVERRELLAVGRRGVTPMTPVFSVAASNACSGWPSSNIT